VVSTSLQLAGALLLGYMIAFRRKKNIIISSSISVMLKGEKPRIAEDKWVETHGYRIGFSYIIIGYILPVIETELNISSSAKIFLIFFITSHLTIIGALVSDWLGKRSFKKMTYEDFYENAPHGAIMVEVDKTDSRNNDKLKIKQ
jgi:uncharacterized membrane protein (DUF441 family)